MLKILLIIDLNKAKLNLALSFLILQKEEVQI